MPFIENAMHRPSICHHHRVVGEAHKPMGHFNFRGHIFCLIYCPKSENRKIKYGKQKKALQTTTTKPVPTVEVIHQTIGNNLLESFFEKELEWNYIIYALFMILFRLHIS